MSKKVSLKVIGPNQTEVTVGDLVLFFSYETLVGLKTGNKMSDMYVTGEKHSRTTSGHINAFVNRYWEATKVPQYDLERMAALEISGW